MSDEVNEIKAYRESDVRNALDQVAKRIEKRDIISKAINIVQRGGDWHTSQGSCTTACKGKYTDPVTKMFIDYDSAAWGNGGHLNIIYDGKPVFQSREQLDAQVDRPYVKIHRLIIDAFTDGDWVAVLDELPRRPPKPTPPEENPVVSRHRIIGIGERFGNIFD